MKRFTTEGRNDQQGRGLIAAHRNAEEEAPLGLSFEGGLAGPRRYSRRQALGLLGGSLAGFTLLSSGLAAPAKSDHVFGIKKGDIITLRCLGEAPGSRYLDGRTHNGTVGLAPHTNPPFTGTKWEVSYMDHFDSTIVLRCEGKEPGPRYLDGRTQDGTVGLAPHTNPPFTGTLWQLSFAWSSGGVALRCEGKEPGPRYLDGRTQDGTVGLAPHTNPPFTGTRWSMDVVQAPPAA